MHGPAPAERPGTRLLLITPRNSYRVAAYLRAAERLHLELIIASDGAHSLTPALRDGIHVDLSDPGQARDDILRQLPTIHGVIGSDDAVVELAASVASQLGLPGNPETAGALARRKDLARATLREHKLAVPAFEVLDFAAIRRGARPSIAWPVVLKPLAMSASRGVIRADDEAAFVAASERIARITRAASVPEERDQVLVEQYLPGEEIALEGMLHDGGLSVIAVFDKPEPLVGPCFEESYYVTPSRKPEAILGQAAELVQATCAAYGLRQGPVHAEVRINDAGVWMLETAARTIGGQCAMLVEFATGRSLEELVLQNAQGLQPQSLAANRAAGVLMLPTASAGVLRRVEGVLAAQSVAGVETIELWAREGQELVPLPEGASYLGFVFATAQTPREVEHALRQAHACLRVVTAPKWDIVAA